MSEATKFHVTEALLLERAALHRLVDYFWKVLPHTRDEIYKEMAASLSVPEIHISDMTSEQIKEIARTFQEKLSCYAPCRDCAHARETSYGMYACNRCQPYWERPNNAFRRCDFYVPRVVSNEGSR